jgi:uncharacterized RDD family membrane protein YckC
MAVSSASTRSGPRPSRPAVRVSYASFESRVAAGALDVLVLFIIAALFAVAGAMVVLISSDFERVDPSGTAINIFWACIGAIAPAFLLYFFIALAWKGQTVGAAVMALMVIRSDGRPLGVLGAMARVIGQLAYVLILAAGALAAFAVRDRMLLAAIAVGVACLLAALGFLVAAFDSHRRTLHDRLAGTIVVRIE